MKSRLTAIYTRVSSQQQKADETIESQVAALLDYAKNNNLEVPWILKDEGYSGSTLDRPGLDELRDLVRENALDNVLVYSPDRLARRFVNQLILEEEFLKYSINLIYLNGAKSQTPEDLLLKNFQGIFAEYERSQILDRSRRGKLYKARQGHKSILPNAPYGYNSERTNFYSINAQQAQIVNEIFHLYVKKNLSLRAIAKYLESKNISSPNGSLKWNPTSIRGILSNSAYTGTTYYGKTEKGSGDCNRIARYRGTGKVVKPKNPKKGKPRDEWLPIAVPSIISQSEFEAAQVVLKKNKQYSSRNTKVPSILQGLLVCGCCGNSYYKRRYGPGGKWSGYYCHSQLNKQIKWCGNPSINQTLLDDIVWDNALNIIKDPQLIEKEIQRRISEHPKKKELEKRTGEVERELKRIKQAQDKLLDAYQDTDCIELSELRVRLKQLKIKEDEFRKELNAINAYSIWEERQEDLKITIEEFRQQININAENMTVHQKQKILRAIIEEIVVQQGEITINHSISLKSAESCRLCTVSGY